MMDEFYMNLAIKQANKAIKRNEVPVGAIVVKNEKVISYAYNKKDARNNVLDHAELICIRKASKKVKNWRLDGCTLYVTLEPCPMCASAIQQSRISRVVYGASSKNAENAEIVQKIFSTKGANQIVDVCGLVLEETCGQLISDFFQKKRQ